MNDRFTIIGGGIAGLCAALVLQQKGYPVLLFEADTQLREGGGGLVLAVNALKSLYKLGLAQAVLSRSQELPVFKLVDQKGIVISEMADDFLLNTFGMNNAAITRQALLQVLLSALQTDCLILGKRAVDLSRTAKRTRIYFADGTIHDTDYLLIADGVHSPLRQKLVPGSLPRYAGYTCWRAVIDTPNTALRFGFEALGPAGRCGLVPLPNQQTYWFALANAARNSGTMKRVGSYELSQRFKAYPPPIPGLIQQTKDNQLIWHDIVDLAPIPHFAFGNILLVGDAAHATTPNMAQGACQAIEDAAVLLDILGPEISILTAFKQFEQRRLKRTHQIVRDSWLLGRVAQLENPLLIGLRNFVFRRIPPTTTAKQLQAIYSVDF